MAWYFTDQVKSDQVLKKLANLALCLWRAGWLLTNRQHLRWINNWIVQCRSHRYYRWWQIIDFLVNVLAIKAPVITRSVLWRAGWVLKNEDSWGGFITELFNGVGTGITGDDNLLLFDWLSLRLNHWLSWGFVRCLTWLFHVILLWQLPIPFGRCMMNTIWVCGGVVCLLFVLLMVIKIWEPNFWRNNCIHVWVLLPGIKLITSFFSLNIILIRL